MSSKGRYNLAYVFFWETFKNWLQTVFWSPGIPRGQKTNQFQRYSGPKILFLFTPFRQRSGQFKSTEGQYLFFREVG